MKPQWMWSMLGVVLFITSCETKDTFISLENDAENSYSITFSYSSSFSDVQEKTENIPIEYDITDTLTIDFQNTQKDFGHSETIDSYISVIIGNDLKNNTFALFDTNNNENFSDEQPVYFTSETNVVRGRTHIIATAQDVVEIEYYDGSKVRNGKYGLILKQITVRTTRTMYAISNIHTGIMKIKRQKYSFAIYDDSGIALDEYSNIWIDSNGNGFQDSHDYNEMLKFAPCFGNKSFIINEYDPFGTSISFCRSNQPAIGIGLDAPEFLVTDLSGIQHSLKDYRGKYVLLFFWSSTCFVCKQVLPLINDIYENIGQNRLNVLGISEGEIGDIQTMTDGYDWPNCSISDDILEKYRIGAWPTLFLIDKNGILIENSSLLSGESIEQNIKNLIDTNH